MTPTWELSMAEFTKTLRDMFFVAVAAMIPEALRLAEAVDFWEYQMAATIIIAWLTALWNRYFNIIRP